MKIHVRLILLLSLLGLPVAAQAQTSVDAGKAFKVILTHDGVNASEYQITLDPPGTTAPNIVQTLAASVRDTATGEVTFDVPAQTSAGSWTVAACARNVDPLKVAQTATACAPTLAFAVVIPKMPSPAVPTIRISGTLTLANGTVQPFTATVDTISLALPTVVK
jgi:hypothetical protein